MHDWAQLTRNRQRDSNGNYIFTMEELVDNYVTFLVAGGDPTAHTITFAIYEIVSVSGQL